VPPCDDRGLDTEKAVDQLAAELDRRWTVVDGVGVLLRPLSRILDLAERYDLGFFLALMALAESVAAPVKEIRPHLPVSRKLVSVSRGHAVLLR
jgi:hypothetical protein